MLSCLIGILLHVYMIIVIFSTKLFNFGQYTKLTFVWSDLFTIPTLTTESLAFPVDNFDLEPRSDYVKFPAFNIITLIDKYYQNLWPIFVYLYVLFWLLIIAKFIIFVLDQISNFFLLACNRKKRCSIYV